jgi:drug/metabolite transporter (DMT)-like permease
MTSDRDHDAPRRRGAVFGLLAAALFGLSAPASKWLLATVAPQLLAGLLYLGAGVGLTAYRALRPRSAEAPLRRSDVAPLAGVVVAGGVLGPLLLLVGLTRVSALTGSLLLNLEGPLTIVLAVVLFREHLGRYAATAAAFILVGAGVLKAQPGGAGVDALGVACIAGACLCWALDNNLTQRLSLRDPFAVVRVKTLAAGTFNTGLAFVFGADAPTPRIALGALALGCISYGVSVVLDAYALRLVGAAREAAYFATAPFCGALASVALLREPLSWFDVVAMTLMAAGVVFLLRERHEHRHAHDVLEHEHKHVHDEHHRHEHPPGVAPNEPHSHAHRHEPIIHEHSHAPDAHHRHRHGAA